MRKLVLFFLLFAFYSLSGQNLADTLPLDPQIRKGKLENGLTYYVRHNEKPKNRVFMRLVVKAGSVFEDEDQLGLAHFCEHMAFNGTKHFPKHRLIEFLESTGMKFGADLNAYTSFDETVYMLEVPLDKPQNFDTALLVLYDWAWLVAYEDEEIEAERGVIYEEYRLGKGPWERLNRQTMPVLLYGSKYAQRLPIGKPEVFNQCPPDNLRRFYHKWYRPDLQAVIIVGDINPDTAVNKIKRLFSNIPKPQKPVNHTYPEIPDHNDIKVKVATDKEMGYSIVNIFIKHDYKPTITYADFRKSIVRRIWTKAFDQRLNKLALKPGSPFAYSYAYYSHFLDHKATFTLTAFSKKDVKQTVIQLLTELERVKKYGFTSEEIENAKKSLMKGVEKRYNERNTTKSQVFVNRCQANFLASQTPLMSYEEIYNTYKKFLPQITDEEVNQVGNQLITDKNEVIILQLPEKKNIVKPTEEEILKIADSIQKADIKPFTSQNKKIELVTGKIKKGKIVEETQNKYGFTVWKLKNGATVLFKNTDFKSDEIKFYAFSKGGYSVYELNEDLINALLGDEFVRNSGVDGLSEADLQTFEDTHNFSLTPFVDLYSEGFTGTSTKKDFENMLKLLYLYFTQPRFDSSDYQAYREQTIAFLENRDSDPFAAWSDSLDFILSGRSPYEKPLTAEDYNKVDFKKAYEYYKDRFADPNNFTFVFVGNVDFKDFKNLILKYIGGLPTKKRTEKPVIRNATVPVGKNITVQVKKSSDKKAIVYMMFTGYYERNIENEVKIKALAQIFTDKLLKRIREEEALTYSISASPKFYYQEKPKYRIGIFFSCNPDTLNYVIDEIKQIANDLKNQGITETDLQKAKEILKKEQETRLKENKFWLNNMVNRLMFGVQTPMDYQEYMKAVESLTVESLKQAAKEYLNNNSVIVVSLLPKE